MSENNELQEINEQVEITKIEGRTQIVFKKALLKGKVTSSEVLNTILIAAKLQGEYYIKKLSKGTPLESHEVKALKELAEITKLEINPPVKDKLPEDMTTLNTVKASLYKALEERLKS